MSATASTRRCRTADWGGRRRRGRSRPVAHPPWARISRALGSCPRARRPPRRGPAFRVRRGTAPGCGARREREISSTAGCGRANSSERGCSLNPRAPGVEAPLASATASSWCGLTRASGTERSARRRGRRQHGVVGRGSRRARAWGRPARLVAGLVEPADISSASPCARRGRSGRRACGRRTTRVVLVGRCVAVDGPQPLVEAGSVDGHRARDATGLAASSAGHGGPRSRGAGSASPRPMRLFAVPSGTPTAARSGRPSARPSRRARRLALGRRQAAEGVAQLSRVALRARRRRRALSARTSSRARRASAGPSRDRPPAAAPRVERAAAGDGAAGRRRVRRGAVELPRLAPQLEEDVLDDVLGLRGTPEHPIRGAVDAPRMLVVGTLEGVRIPEVGTVFILRRNLTQSVQGCRPAADV